MSKPPRTVESPLVTAARAAREKQAAKPAKKPRGKAIDGKAEVVKADDLPSLTAGIVFAQEQIDGIVFKSLKDQLPFKLKQGLFCLKGRNLYAIEDPSKQGAKGGRPKTRSESDQVSAEVAEGPPKSFNDWILTQPIPKATAYDLMRAVEGLGLDHNATEKQLTKAYTAALKDAEKGGGTLTITRLKNLAAGQEQEQQEEEQPADPEALRAEAREQAAHFIKTWDKGVKAGNLEHADKATLKELHDFLTTSRDHIAKRLRAS